MGAGADPLVADGFGDWAAKVIAAFNREYWRLALLQLVVCVPSWALAGWIGVGVIDTPPVVSFLARQHIPWLLDLEVVVDDGIQASIFEARLGPVEAIADITTILTVGSFSFALCASLCMITLSAAGRRATVLTGLRLAARRVWPVLGWTLASLAMVAIGFQVPLLATLFLGVPFAILVSFVAGIQLTAVFAASLIGVITFERAGPLRCFELVADRWWPTLARLLAASLIIAIYEMVIGSLVMDKAYISALAQFTLWGLLNVPVGVLASAVHMVTYAELSPSTSTEELADEITDEIADENADEPETPPRRERLWHRHVPSSTSQPTTHFARPEFGIAFDYPANMVQTTVSTSTYKDAPRPGTVSIRLLLDPENGITLSQLELEGTFTGRDPSTIRRSVDQLMTKRAGGPIRGTSLTVGGLPALEYDFACPSSPVPTLRSHSVVLVGGTCQYLINCESTDTCREEMERATAVVLRSLRRR